MSRSLSGVPYGEVFVEERNNSWSTPYKFNGKELDEETGLYYYGARYYDPKTSVWVSVDPLAEKFANTGSYVYCHDNPLKFIDPDGINPKKNQHWMKFIKELAKATTVAVTAGFQLSLSTKVGTKTIGIDLNAASVDLVSVRNGKLSPNAKRPLIQQNAAIGIGVVGAEYSNEIKDNGKTTTKETKTSVGIMQMSREKTTTQNFVEARNGEMIPISKPSSESHNKVDDISRKAGLIIVTEFSVSTERAAKALSHLITDK